mmetsp:Transcript_47094/g.106810  ORF Transcript_47094/g.106810 Transcript_47094/m.106810 type:complete len:250 (+) Transcript_47094:763-1512(+)
MHRTRHRPKRRLRWQVAASKARQRLRRNTGATTRPGQGQLLDQQLARRRERPISIACSTPLRSACQLFAATAFARDQPFHHPAMRCCLCQRNAPLSLLGEQPPQEWMCGCRHLLYRGTIQAAAHDVSASLQEATAPIEGRDACKHLEEQYPDRPDIDTLVIGLAINHLRRQHTERAAKGHAAVCLARIGTPPKVGHLGRKVVTEEDVLRLQVSVDDSMLMQEADPVHDLREDVRSIRLAQCPGLPEVPV